MSTPIRIAKVVYERAEKCPDTLAGLSRGNKIFSPMGESVCGRARAKFIGFPRPAAANFAAVALFLARSALLKLFARRFAGDIVQDHGEKSHRRRRRRESSGSVKYFESFGDKTISRRNCLNATAPTSFFPISRFTCFPAFPPISAYSQLFPRIVPSARSNVSITRAPLRSLSNYSVVPDRFSA